MSIPRYHLDSNILLRFFTGEPAAMFASSSAFIKSAERGDILLELSALVLAETAFTLESFFQLPRKKVAELLLEFVKRSGVRLAEKDLLLDALEWVKKTGVHLVDAHLAASAAQTELPIYSFDRDFDKFTGVIQFEPKA